MKGGFKNWLSDFAEGSAIMRGLGKLANGMYKCISSGVYGFVFGSYDTVCETYDDSAIGREQAKKRGRISRFLSRNIENSIYINAVSAMMLYLSRLSMRVIGIFFMSAGFYTLLAQTLIYLITDNFSPVSSVIAFSLIAFGLPLLLSGRAFCRVVSDSAFLGGIARGFCGFRERSFKYDGPPTGKKGIAFILGLPFGILSCFVDPALLVLLLLGIIVAYLVMVNPEFGYNGILLSVPFLAVLPHSTILLMGCTLYTFFSYVMKLIMGKRYFRSEFMDALIVCFMAVLMCGGIVSYGGAQSLRVALVYITLVIGYFLTVGIVNSKEALKRTVNVLGVSMTLVSVYSLYQNFGRSVSAEWINNEMLGEIEGRVFSIFQTPNMFGAYLILLLPMIAAGVLGENSWYKKLGSMLCFGLGCACLIYTWAKGAWLGFIFAAFIFILMWNRKAMGIVVIAVIIAPFVISLLPQSIASQFTGEVDLADVFANYRMFIWRESADLATDYALTGIGIGEQAFC
ncbi:MAG: O-antigen ligase family protein, partial [Clostridia bacterium]|nr:O-antigen ligase family protein [Clostridia bacterium]